jgi:hypothetical protein
MPGDSAPPVTSRHAQRSDRSPLHDVRHHARRSTTVDSVRIHVSHERVCRVGCQKSAAAVQARGAVWWSQTGSNRRPPACKAGALPTELWPRTSRISAGKFGWLASRSSRQLAQPAFAIRLRRATFAALRERRLVGLGRFELPTSRLSSARSNQLSYKPEPGVSDQKSAIRKHGVSDD